MNAYRVHFPPEIVPKRTDRGTIYIPIHGTCFQIAEYFIQRTLTAPLNGDSSQIRIGSLRALWEVLYRRLRASGNRIGILPEPHGYYGGKWCRGLDWEPENNPRDAEVSN